MTGNYEDKGANQSSNPHGEEGFRAVEQMNREHVPQITWGIDNLPDMAPGRILDIGCGGGVFSRLVLEKYPEAKGDALDISPVSVEYCSQYNSDLIDVGRYTVTEGNVIDMPYGDGTFDLVVSNASHFFWPDLPTSFKEVSRVIAKGGVLCLTAGMHVDEEGYRRMKAMDRPGFNLFRDEDLLAMLGDAGIDAKCFVEPVKGFGCYIGVKNRV